MSSKYQGFKSIDQGNLYVNLPCAQVSHGHLVEVRDSKSSETLGNVLKERRQTSLSYTPASIIKIINCLLWIMHFLSKAIEYP